MRMEVHVHADIPIVEGVSRKQLESALSPWLDYLDSDAIDDVKSLEPDEPGIRFDEPNRVLYLCWTGEIGRSFQRVLEASLDALGPYAEEAVEVDLNFYHESGEQESQLLFVDAYRSAQRPLMLLQAEAAQLTGLSDAAVWNVRRAELSLRETEDSARLAAAQAYETAGKLDDAKKAFATLESSSVAELKGEGLLGTARIARIEGKSAEARGTYEKIRKELAGSDAARQADTFLSNLK